MHRAFWMFSLFVVLISSFSAEAALLTLQQPLIHYDKFRGLRVTYAEKATVNVDGQSSKVELTGTGVRVKKVFLFQANVYFAQSFATPRTTSRGAWTRADILSAPTRAMKLMFLRDLGVDQLQSAIKESMAKNGLDVSSAPIKSLLEFLHREVKEGEELVLVTARQGDGQTVQMELQGKTFKSQAPGLGDSLWRVWFGTPADSGLEDLQKRLLGPVALSD